MERDCGYFYVGQGDCGRGIPARSVPPAGNTARRKNNRNPFGRNRFCRHAAFRARGQGRTGIAALARALRADQNRLRRVHFYLRTSSKSTAGHQTASAWNLGEPERSQGKPSHEAEKSGEAGVRRAGSRTNLS